MALIDELLVGLGFEFDEKELDNFNKSVDKAKASMLKFVAVAGAATAAVGALVASSAAATDEVTKQARQLNILVGEYDALLQASDETVGNTQAMSGALQNLSVRASEAARGVGSGVEAFGMLGLSVTDANGELKTTDVLLSETADALNGLSDQGQRLELADKLGLREIDLLLRQGSEGIKGLTDSAKDLGVITEADSKAAEEFNDSMSRMFRVLNTLRRNIATALLPQFESIIKAFTEWVKANKEIIKSRFEKFVVVLGKVITLLGKAVGFVLDLFGELVDAVGGLDNALNLLVITFGAIIAMRIGAMLLGFITLMKSAGAAALLLNAKILLIPILIGAAIVALGLLIEDLITFVQGGDSLFGRFLDEFPLAQKAFDTMRSTLTDIFELIDKIGTGIGEFAGAVVIGTEKFLDDPLGGVGDFLGGLNPFSSDVPSNVGGATSNSNSTMNQENVFNITSNNPEEVGEAVRKVIEDSATTAMRNTTSAVDI